MKVKLNVETHINPLMNALKFLENSKESYKIDFCEKEAARILADKIFNFFVAYSNSEKLPVFSHEEITLLSKAMNKKIEDFNLMMRGVRNSPMQVVVAMPFLEKFDKDKKVLLDSYDILAKTAKFHKVK